MEIKYRNKEIETMSREELAKVQLAGLKETVKYALRTPFYKERLRNVGIESPEDLKTLADIKKIPFTTKNDLRDGFPEGFLAVPKSEVVRLHASSGTTGIPTVIYHNQHDIDRWTELVARAVSLIGATNEDILQNMMTYGLFTGGLALHYGGERLGMMVVPTSSGNTRRQFSFLRDFKATVVHATPSYMLHMYSKIEEEGFKLSDFHIKKVIAGAEPYSADIAKKIENLYGVDVYNNYGLSEMNGPGVAIECVYKNGMHVSEDAFYLEIIDPETDQEVEDGVPGEVVLSILCRQATPLLRYRTHDLSRVIPGQCECGRTFRRLERIKGRTDDMLIINGVNVFPSQIEEILMRMPEVGTNYLIVVDKNGALDQVTVKTEINSEVFSDDARDLNALKARIRDRMKATIFISPNVELHQSNSLPVAEGKAKRVIDNRKI